MTRNSGARALGELSVQPAVTTIVLHGELDLTTIEPLRDLLDEAVAPGPRRLVVDLGDVPFVDLLSLSAILAAADAVRKDGGLAAVSGASQPVRRICALLNADDVLMAAVPLQRRVAG